MRQPVIQFRRQYEFRQDPQVIWDRIEEVDQFETWWPWLEEFRLDEGALTEGAVMHGVIVPPLPYRMRIRVALTRCQAPALIDATIGGDLEGEARLRLRPLGAGARIEVGWTVEMMQRPMRLASRFSGPLLQWGHDRVVENTVAVFRRRLDTGS